MGALKAIALAAALAICCASSPPARAETIADWRPFVAEASLRFGVPIEWIERVMRAESGGRTMFGGRPTTSRAGAMGLMQVMPATWAAMRREHALGNDPHDPRDNILAGTAYLRAMYDRFGYPGLFAAYNAGPGRYAAYLAGNRRLPQETRSYLAAVAGAQTSSAAPQPSPLSPPKDRLFVRLSESAPPTQPISTGAQPSGLFVAISPR